MKLGLQIPNFSWPGGPAKLAARLAEIARVAEDVGYDSIWVMDHYLQIPPVGPAEMEMLEGYTALSYIAACTSRVGIGTMVTGVTYRHPGFLVKQVTTLDVLSGGRAWFGIGAAWFEREHTALGIPFPPLSERFERLKEAIQIALQMWSDNNGPYVGRHYRLAETLNSPQCLRKPHPPVLIGGSGERKTLRLVARYGDACNIFGGDIDTVRHKLQVLRQHCVAEGRDYEEIEKTVLYPIDIGSDGSRVGQVLDNLYAFAELGIQTAIGGVAGVENLTPMEIVGRDIIPKIAVL